MNRIPGDEFPEARVSGIIPDLAVEVLSRKNTVAEIELKLDHYFEAGVRMVWIIKPMRPANSTGQGGARVQTTLDDVVWRYEAEEAAKAVSRGDEAMSK